MSQKQLDKLLTEWYNKYQYDLEVYPSSGSADVFKALEEAGYLHHMMPTKEGRERLRELGLEPPKRLASTKGLDEYDWILTYYDERSPKILKYKAFHSLRDALYYAIRLLVNGSDSPLFQTATQQEKAALWDKYVTNLSKYIKQGETDYKGSVSERRGEGLIIRVQPLEFE